MLALGDFAVGKLQLVGLTPLVGMTLHADLQRSKTPTIDLGVAYEDAKNGTMHITAQHTKLAFGKSSTKANPIVQYWAVPGTEAPHKANMEKQMRQVSSKVANESYSVEIPVMVNTVKIKAGTELVYLHTEPSEPVETPAKRQKGDVPKGKGTGKGKRKQK